MGSLGCLHATASVSVNCAHSPSFLLPHQKRGLRRIDIQQGLLWILVNNSGAFLRGQRWTGGGGVA